MSDSPPEEAPVYHKSLTPESPRPLHVPSPANIPILENQIEPFFNLISSHTEPPYAARDLTHMDQDLAAAAATLSADIPTQNLDASETQQDIDGNISPEDAAALLTKQPEEPDHTNTTTSDVVADTATAVLNADDSAAAAAAASTTTNSASHAANLSVPAQSEVQSDENEPSIPTLAAQQDATLQSEAGLPEEQNAAQDVATDGMQALLESLSAPRNAQSEANASVPGLPQDAATSNELQKITDGDSTLVAPENSVAQTVNLTQTGNAQQDSTQQPIQQHSAEAANTQNLQNPANLISHMIPPPGLGTNTAPGTNGAPSLPITAPPQSFGAPGVPLPTTSTAPGVTHSRPATGTFGPDARYTAFLDEESVFTAENAWEKFPAGSRLFVGNLPTESVTKRDVWNIFEKYGKLAQISIKQAYGFVQFMDLESCEKAMKYEQNGKIKDRTMHLEVSKPPKAARNTQGSSDADRLRDRHRRIHSRSPDRRRGQRGGQNRNLPYSDFRDEQPRRGRDDYRPGRSPSPRRRGGDDYRPGRERSPDRYYDGRRRSRSPGYGRGGYGRRSPSPRRPASRDDDLPLPKRAPQDVPDVQIILLEDVNRPFIDYVVKGFRNEGMRVDVLNMPRVSLDAVILRQIREGVYAVCKLTRKEERTGKVPLQVFDRSQGSNNVKFDEYDDLTIDIAAKLAVRAKAASMPNPSYGNGPTTYVPPWQQNQTALPLPPNAAQLAHLYPQLAENGYQNVLNMANTQQTTPTQPGFPHQAAGQPDMSAILGNVAPQQQHQNPQQPPVPQIYQYAQHAQPSAHQQAPYGYPPNGYPGQQAANAYPGSYGQNPSAAAQDPNQVQSIMQQLAGIQRKT